MKAAKKQSRLKLPANTIQGGNDKGAVVQLRFFPRTIKVPVGGTVNVQVKSLPEIHSFSFGPAAYLNDRGRRVRRADPGRGARLQRPGGVPK